MSPDGKLLIIVGDNPDGILVDSNTGKVIVCVFVNILLFLIFTFIFVEVNKEKMTWCQCMYT